MRKFIIQGLKIPSNIAKRGEKARDACSLQNILTIYN